MISNVIAVVSVVIALVALMRARKANKQSGEVQQKQTEIFSRIAELHEKQAELAERIAGHQLPAFEQAEQATQHADVDVELRVDPQPGFNGVRYRVFIRNAPSGGPATQVDLEFRPREGQKRSLLATGKGKLPIPILNPGQECGFIAGISDDCSPPFDFQLTWMDGACEPGMLRSKTVSLTPP